MKRILDLVKMAEQGNMEMENLFIHARFKIKFQNKFPFLDHFQSHPNRAIWLSDLQDAILFPAWMFRTHCNPI